MQTQLNRRPLFCVVYAAGKSLSAYNIDCFSLSKCLCLSNFKSYTFNLFLVKKSLSLCETRENNSPDSYPRKLMCVQDLMIDRNQTVEYMVNKGFD